MDVVREFKGKRITMLGLGLLGRGVGDAEFLARCGAQVLVTDKKAEGELTASVERLNKYPNISFRLGGHDLDDFTHTGVVLKAAGVRLDSPEVAAARNAGVPVVMSTALFAKYASEEGAIVVGITGTRGKSTIAHLIYHTLKKARKSVFLGGNVRGVSTLAMLPDIKKDDIAVLELDSWQLQGFGDLKISPHIAVFTNLMPDHQNYYENMDDYFADKANIFRYQKKGDSLFVGGLILNKARAARPAAAPHVPPPLPHDWKLNVIGAHNRENAALAAAALKALGLSEKEIRTGLESFAPVEGRLQFVRAVRGVKIYNDNNATTPEATFAALEALGNKITLICGGSEKGLRLDELVAEIKQRVSHLIVLVHPEYRGSQRLIGLLRAHDVTFEEADSLEAALQKGMKGTNGEKGTLLFSPAFASFGMFRNEYERNDQFLRIVRSI